MFRLIPHTGNDNNDSNVKIRCFHGGDYDEYHLLGVMPCGCYKDQRFGGTYSLHYQVDKNRQLGTTLRDC
jgi:hypothetical protein